MAQTLSRRRSNAVISVPLLLFLPEAERRWMGDTAGAVSPDIEVTAAAHRLGISRTTLSRVINGRSGISPELAIRLERAGVSTARFWMTLQTNYELASAEQRIQPVVQRL